MDKQNELNEWSDDYVPEESVGNEVGAREALIDARHVLARLLDYAVLHSAGLTDESPLAIEALKVIAAIDAATAGTTDVGTGLPLARATLSGNPKDEVVK